MRRLFMTTLALIVAIYTLPMLVIHVSTGKILEAWDGADGSLIKERFPPRRALRVEAAYWILVLAAWPLWRAAAWKALVAIFAAIHIGIWLTNELGKVQISGAPDQQSPHNGRLNRAIVAFDFIEAAMLVAIGVLTILYLARR